MTLEEIRGRYEVARLNAACALEDMSQGADPYRVYDAIEIATLWAMALANPSNEIRPAILDKMFGTTNGWKQL